jgi:hypothetical protein
MLVLAAAALALGLGSSARADVCVVVDPLVHLGCRDEQGAPAGGEPKASSEPEGAPEPEPARRSTRAAIARRRMHRPSVEP